MPDLIPGPSGISSSTDGPSGMESSSTPGPSGMMSDSTSGPSGFFNENYCKWKVTYLLSHAQTLTPVFKKLPHTQWVAPQIQ